jgi:urease subunit gamma/beta
MLNLTPTELERLVIFQAAELARRRRARGRRLNQAEAEALLLDEALEFARDGVPLAELRNRVSSILTTDDVLPGVAALVPMLVVEGQFPEGTKLVTVFDPIRPGRQPEEADPLGPPGAVIPADGDIELNAGRPTVVVDVTNTGDRVIHVSSHYHFFEVNKALDFDRRAAFGMRLDVPAGCTVRFEPGERTPVTLVALGGRATPIGLNRLAGPGGVDAALERARAQGYRGA